MTDALEITRRANSNLAFALKILPSKRRQDMVVYYAFCRVIDDLADDDQRPLEQREAILHEWRDGLTRGFADPDPLQREVVALRNQREIPTPLLTGLIDGCLMDLKPRRFQTWDDLNDYIWKVAGTVGLVSIRLFGCQSPESKQYAEALATALQLTNILRDIGTDLREHDRIYLPLQDLEQFGYSEVDLANQVQDERFQKMMAFQAARTENLYEEAALSLTRQDRRALRPARIMGDIYHNLLRQMKRDHFRVFDHQYRVSGANKTLILFKHLFR